MSEPERHDTLEMPRVEVSGNALDAILSEVRSMRAEHRESTRELKADISLIANDVSLVKERVSTVERRLDEHERRADTNSIRVKAESGVNLKQDAALSGLIERVGAVETTLSAAATERADTAAKIAAIHNTVVGVVKNPKVVAVGRVVFWLVMGSSAALGAREAAKEAVQSMTTEALP